MVTKVIRQWLMANGMAKCAGVKEKCKGPCPCRGMFINHYLSLTDVG